MLAVAALPLCASIPRGWSGSRGDAADYLQPTAYSLQSTAFPSLYLTRHRAYDAAMGRFISADPMGIGGGPNLYAYCLGNPLAYIDPLGLCAAGYDQYHSTISADNRPYSSYYSDGFWESGTGPGSRALYQADQLVPEAYIGTAMGDQWVSDRYQTAANAIAAEFAVGEAVGIIRGTVGNAAKSLPALRTQYEAEVRLLEDVGLNARAAGQTTEATASMLNAERNALKLKYRQFSPADQVKVFEQRNIEKYGNPVGPTVEQLRAQGRTWEDIIESAARPGGKDLGF